MLSEGGVYIHYPICSRACYYCDFFFRVNLKERNNIENAILKEIELRNFEFPEKIISIYFGGGTPSLANNSFLEKVINKILTSSVKEITIEANPEDITENKVKFWRTLGINRVSLGIQSLDDTVLKKLNRPHSVEQALNSVEIVKKYFGNFSVDFIIGIPFQTTETYEKNLIKFIEKFFPSHISVYILTIEENSAFERFIRRGILEPDDEEKIIREFYLTKDILESFGYVHYEISNYCLEGKKAIHNSLYWEHLPYIGLGPSAHSFSYWERKANIYHFRKYINNVLCNNFVPTEFVEKLSLKDIFNEKVMLSLRKVRSGLNLKDLEFYFIAYPEYREKFIHKLNKQVELGNIHRLGERIYIPRDRLVISDKITMELMI